MYYISSYNNFNFSKQKFKEDIDLLIKKHGKDPRNFTEIMVKIIMKTIENKCNVYKKISLKDPVLIDFLNHQFAHKFIEWHGLDQNSYNNRLWLCFELELDERWSILGPFWLTYLKQTKCFSRLEWYILVNKIKSKIREISFIKKIKIGIKESIIINKLKKKLWFRILLSKFRPSNLLRILKMALFLHFILFIYRSGLLALVIEGITRLFQGVLV